MQYDYVITLKRDHTRKADLVSFLLLIFSVLTFIYVQLHAAFNGFIAFAILTICIGLVLQLVDLRKGKQLSFRIWLFVAGILWIGMPFLQWLSILFIILGFLEVQMKYPLEIGFYTEGLVLNTLFKKRISWTQLQSVMLKDGLLTIDFRNNTLFQKEVLDDDEPDADEDEFNEYCRAKLVNLR